MFACIVRTAGAFDSESQRRTSPTGLDGEAIVRRRRLPKMFLEHQVYAEVQVSLQITVLFTSPLTASGEPW